MAIYTKEQRKEYINCEDGVRRVKEITEVKVLGLTIKKEVKLKRARIQNPPEENVTAEQAQEIRNAMIDTSGDTEHDD